MSWDEYCFEDPWESYDRCNEHWEGYNNSYDNNTYTKRRVYPKDKRSLELANTLKGLLKKEGIDIHNINQAASGSCYIKFYDDELGQCRVGNHEELGRLGYRWHVRSDLKEKYVDKKKGHNQFVYPSNDLEGLVRHIRNYLNKIKGTGDEFKCV
jgi:hypothetical protein